MKTVPSLHVSIPLTGANMRGIVLLLVCCATCMARADDLPEGVKNTQNPNDISLSPSESLKQMRVPKGFSVTLFAGEPDIRRPIAFDFDDRGRLWVVENYSHQQLKEGITRDRIIILEDKNGDGVFDERKVFWDKGRYLTGICFGLGGVWVANTPELIFIPDRDRDDKPDRPPVVVLDGFQKSSNNVVNNLHWGPDGWLYGAIGLANASFIGKPGSSKEDRVKITRGMWRFDPWGGAFEVLADGMVNPWGADFNQYGDLITTNTVLAHLWHIVTGMHCQRRARESDNPFVYERIQSITDHLHWGGGRWTASRKQEDRHSVAGGGHAHCGAMIYLGDNWPDRYRGTFFTLNLHGNRLNNDKLAPSGSTYVGVHSDDFLFANDEWFRGLSVKYGPDGGVFVTDWHDFGECHDNDGSHRTSGRIYKVVYGKPKKPIADLQLLSNIELARLHQHKNEWYVRRARRILHERARARDNMKEVAGMLRDQFRAAKEEPKRLSALWTLYVIDQLPTPTLVDLVRHESEHVRRWAIRLLTDHHPPSSSVLSEFVKLAQREASPKVRLALAVVLNKLPLDQRWQLGTALATRQEDVDDAYIPLMVWYGVEPAVPLDRRAAMKLAALTPMSQVRRFIARRLVDGKNANPDLALQLAKQTEGKQRDEVLAGMLEAFEGKGRRSLPQDWGKLSSAFVSQGTPATKTLVTQLAVLFGDKMAISVLRRDLHDDRVDIRRRRTALNTLLEIKGGINVDSLHRLALQTGPLRNESIKALVTTNDAKTGELLVGVYDDLSAGARQNVISVLCSRRDFARSLLDSIDNKKIRKNDVSAFDLQRLRAFTALSKRIDKVWPPTDAKALKAAEMTKFTKLLTKDFLAKGDVEAGRKLFDATCAKCHRLFGEGGSVGPDLTGSGRSKVDYLISNLVDPSATVDAAYRLTQVITDEGRVLSGFIVRLEEKHIVLRTQEQTVRLSMEKVDEIKTTSRSMMPEGMLRNLTNEQVRDLFLYLSGSKQVEPASK